MSEKLSDNQKRELVKNDYNAIGREYTERYNQIGYCESYIDDFIHSLQGKNI